MKEITYEFENQIYTVTGDSDFHHRLQNDSIFCEKYFTNSTHQTPEVIKRKYSEISYEGQGCQGLPTNNNITKVLCKNQGNKENIGSSCDPSCDPIPNNNEDFKWSRQATLFLLNLYKERIDRFRNSKVKNKDIWSQILIEFKNQGYIGVTIDILDRKMRNLKKTYKDNKDKKNKTGESCIIWEYFDLMDEIFFNDRTINPTSTISSMEAVQESSQPCLDLEIITKMSSPVSTRTEKSENQKTKVEENKEKESPKLTKAKKAKHLYDHRKKIQEIEKQRVEEVKKLREAIEQNNEIQKDRNEIMRQLLRN